jgi:hypothetical protein
MVMTPEERKEYNRKRYQDHPDKYKECSKKYYQEHPEIHRTASRKYLKTDAGKLSISKCMARRDRDLGFIPLNQIFPGSAGHHINKIQVIFIPEILHKKYPHALNRPETMEKINELAWEFLDQQQYEKYFGK